MDLKSKRPLSPHLQIYKLPLTAMLSVIHRVTGVVLALGAVAFVWILALAANDAEAYGQLHAHLASWYG